MRLRCLPQCLSSSSHFWETGSQFTRRPVHPKGMRAHPRYRCRYHHRRRRHYRRQRNTPFTTISNRGKSDAFVERQTTMERGWLNVKSARGGIIHAARVFRIQKQYRTSFHAVDAPHEGEGEGEKKIDVVAVVVCCPSFLPLLKRAQFRQWEERERRRRRRIAF